jgi:hypothetical protein
MHFNFALPLRRDNWWPGRLIFNHDRDNFCSDNCSIKFQFLS